MIATQLTEHLRRLTGRVTIDDARMHSLELSEFANVRLTPVGPWILSQSDIVDSMTNWRAQFASNYFARFPPSTESMRAFLAKNKVESTDAILFIIEEENSRVLGHLGLKNVTPHAGEVDSVIKNPESRLPRVMECALDRLITWSQGELGVEELSLEVISHNERARSLYERLGFSVVEERALRRVTRGDFVEHESVSSAESNVPYTCIVMRRILGPSPRVDQ